MEASKEGEMPSAPAPESLPSEMKEEKPMRTKLIAAIVVVILVVAAIGAAFAFGVFSPKKKSPVGGAVAVGDTTIDIGGSVKVNSTAKAEQKGATLDKWTWYWGDATNSSGGKELTNATHSYQYGGFYWIYQVVEDSNGKTGSNEASMIRIIVRYYDPAAIFDAGEPWDNTTHPFAVLASDKDIVPENTLVTFNMTGTYGIGGWQWVNPSNHSEGQNNSDRFGLDNLTSLVLDYGDGSTPATITPAAIMTATHTYSKTGHYAATLTAKSSMVNPYGTYPVQTIVMRTIHVLTPTGTAGAIKNPDTFIEATIGEPSTLDPAVDYESAGGNILQNVYETLVWYNGTSASVLKPMLATAVPSVGNGISADGLNYTFDLRPNVKFHDGNTMSADDAVFSFSRILSIHDASSAYWMLDSLVADNLAGMLAKKAANRLVYQWSQNGTNASWIADYLYAQPGGGNHTIVQADIDAVAALVILKTGPLQIKIRLTHPYAGFLSECAFNMMSIVSKAYVTASGHGNSYMVRHEAGTGPYMLVSWEAGSSIHLTRFSGYWGPAPAMKDVYIIKSEDVNTRMLMLQAGDADNIYLPIAYQNTFVGNTLYSIQKGAPAISLTFFVFNFNIDAERANSEFGGTITNDFFQNVHMRKAFVALFNYSLYLHNVARDNAIQPNGVIPKGMFGYNASTPGDKYNLATAIAELKLAPSPVAGQSWFTHGFTIPLFFNSGNTGRQTACQLIKAALEEISATAPGAGQMTATTTGLDWSSSYLPDVVYAAHTFAPMYSIGWAPDYYDPDDYVTPMLDSQTGSYPVFSGYNNSTMDQLVREAARETDLAKREIMYQNLMSNSTADAPYLWLTQANNFNIFRSWVHVQGGLQNYFNPMYSDLYYPLFTKS